MHRDAFLTLGLGSTIGRLPVQTSRELLQVSELRNRSLGSLPDHRSDAGILQSLL
jgi:hypothetical protein